MENKRTMEEIKKTLGIAEDDKIMYIYNWKQTQFYIKKGIVPRGVYVNPKTNLASHIFSKSETEEAFKEWYEICKDRKIAEEKAMQH